MKKTYQNPNTKIVRVQMAQMIAASLSMQGNAQDDTMLSRKQGNSLWDDEEE
ncbi:MAG: hypothetical protein K5928_01730 [Prevotella sp.]|nr:hypothetical protein [Prevotella sp.]